MTGVNLVKRFLSFQRLANVDFDVCHIFGKYESETFDEKFLIVCHI